MPRLSAMPPRDLDEGHRAATQLELFFDLVAVIAIAAVTAAYHHAVSDGHGAEALPNFIFMFVAIWWAWMNYTWFASAFDNDDALFRVLTLVIMAGYLIFAAGTAHIFETLDFGWGIVGWIIMRLGMAGLWLRAALAGSGLHQTAKRYLAGIVTAQVAWTVLYFALPPGSALFMAGGCAIFVLEFSVPIWAEKAGRTPWHRHHIIERFGLLNIIVLGEVLVSLSFLVAGLYDGGPELGLIENAAAGFVIVAALWWLYFIETEHLNSTDFGRVFFWAYGHLLIFGAGAMLAVGLGAMFDVLTDHAQIDAAKAALVIHLAAALYIAALWLVRDLFHPLGWRITVLPLGVAALCVAAWAGVPPWLAAGICVLVLLARSPFRNAARAHPH